jgi:6-phospho-beta-glucosidase
MNKGLKICVLGGGSSYTPELIEGFIRRYDTLPVGEIWLADVPEGERKLNIAGGLARRMVAKNGLPINIRLTLNIDEALAGADFVVTQIRVGFLAARELDETIPLKHGMLGQETNGAGGLFNALRTIPVILKLAEKIAALCPKAFLVNFTNPSGMVTEALARYSGLDRNRIIGLCNVPIHIERMIAGLWNVGHKRVRIDFAGLNHMVYGLRVYLDGADVTSETIEMLCDPDKTKNLSVKNVMDVPYTKEFYRSLGVILCPYHNYYYHSAAMLRHELEEFAQGKVRAQVVRKLEARLFETYADAALDVKPKELEERGGAYYSDAACRLINSIYNDTCDIQAVDTVNGGAITGIDADSAVEVSSVITKAGPRPLRVGRLPLAVRGLVAQIKTFETLAVEAAVEGDYGKVLLALAANPLTPDEKTAKAVADELMAAHKRYLPQFGGAVT